jgi:hypothetical protein
MQYIALRTAAAVVAVAAQRGFSIFGRAQYEQQAVENYSITCQIKNGPSSRAMAEASFAFHFQMTDRQIRRIVALTLTIRLRVRTSFACENHNQFCVASLLVSRCGTCWTPGGIQSPAGEKTEISLL